LDTNINKTNRVGGWLILFCLTLVVSIFELPKLLVKHFKDETINTSLVEFVHAGIISAFALVLLIVLYYKRKKIAPKLAITYCWSMFVLNIIATIYLLISTEQHVGDFFTQNWAPFVYSIITSTIWTLYFLKSERVKQTFIN
jgi:TRAP-type uncharacterized transport system fused permease subunit